MKTALTVILCLLFLPCSLHAQIKEPQIHQKKHPSNPKQTTESTAEVAIIWEGDGVVIISIDGKEITVGSGQEKMVWLKTGKGLAINVKTPKETLLANEFLLVQPEGGLLLVSLSKTGNKDVVFTYETPSQKKAREELEAYEAKKAQEDKKAQESKARKQKEIESYIESARKAFRESKWAKALQEYNSALERGANHDELQDKLALSKMLSNALSLAQKSGYGIAFNPATGKVWLDRNLGAERVATSPTDDAAYGDLYQWGRAADDHQSRNSSTTKNLSSSSNPGHGNFIVSERKPYNWMSTENNNLWQGVNGTNNPCPEGFRIPTESEWEEELKSWSSDNTEGAFASPLKLPTAGLRFNSGGLRYDGFIGYYWSSTVSDDISRHLSFLRSGAVIQSDYRAYGFSVRCIKD